MDNLPFFLTLPLCIGVGTKQILMSEETEEKAKESDTCVLELLFHCLAPNRYCLTNKYLFVFSPFKEGESSFSTGSFIQLG